LRCNCFGDAQGVWLMAVYGEQCALPGLTWAYRRDPCFPNRFSLLIFSRPHIFLRAANYPLDLQLSLD
jgi:hypothetical protein